jgi:hypothetical protein
MLDVVCDVSHTSPVECRYAECHIQALYAECRYAECHILAL